MSWPSAVAVVYEAPPSHCPHCCTESLRVVDIIAGGEHVGTVEVCSTCRELGLGIYANREPKENRP